MLDVDLLNNLSKENYFVEKNQVVEILDDLEKENHTGDISKKLRQIAFDLRNEIYGQRVYLRGLIEISNFCKNDCYYCGIRRGNKRITRYRLDIADILESCQIGYKNSLRTFVLQGGEDPYFSRDKICEIIENIRYNFPDCAITLSLGEKSEEDYKIFFEKGANRYLLRHETINKNHYKLLHPKDMSLTNRLDCIHNLKKLGYQVGVGMMIESPFQNISHLANDLFFIKKYKPHMVGIGPFIPHLDTPFYNFPSGNINITLNILSLIRILIPKVLLPATTALATIHENGTILGLNAGCNVIMPNISPNKARNLYQLYNNKHITDGASSKKIKNLIEKLNKNEYSISSGRGDSLIP